MSFSVPVTRISSIGVSKITLRIPRFLVVGTSFPDSQLEMLAVETPTRVPSCSCEIFGTHRLRSARILCPVFPASTVSSM